MMITNSDLNFHNFAAQFFSSIKIYSVQKLIAYETFLCFTNYFYFQACDKLNFDHILDIKNKIKSVLASNETQTDPEWYGGTFFSTKNRGTISLAVVSSNGDAVAVTSTINLL